MSQKVLELADDTYLRQAEWAKSRHINGRTAARYRKNGLPSLNWGGAIWIGVKQGDAYIASLVRRGPPRRPPPEAPRRGRPRKE